MMRLLFLPIMLVYKKNHNCTNTFETKCKCTFFGHIFDYFPCNWLGYISKEMIKCSYSPDMKEMPNCMNSICICCAVFLCKKALQKFFWKYVAIVEIKLKKKSFYFCNNNSQNISYHCLLTYKILWNTLYLLAFECLYKNSQMMSIAVINIYLELYRLYVPHMFFAFIYDFSYHNPNIASK